MRKKREQEEFERDLELLRIKMDDEEKRRAEIERKAYLEQEENDRKALLEIQIHVEEHAIQEPQIVQFIEEEKVEELIQEPLVQENVHEIFQEPVNEKDDFSSQILPMNFEILVNQAIQNEFKNPNIPLQLEALKLEEEKEKEEEEAINLNQNNEQIQTPKLELPPIQMELFEQWHKHNKNNFFENIKQEYETKIKLKEEDKKNFQQRPRPRTSKTRQTQSIPESLLLKKSNKNSLAEINFLNFHALTSYSLNSLELCTNLTVLVLTNSQITILDGLNNCINLKYINVQVSECLFPTNSLSSNDEIF
jgi:predicted double-glycine peptidase